MKYWRIIVHDMFAVVLLVVSTCVVLIGGLIGILSRVESSLKDDIYAVLVVFGIYFVCLLLLCIRAVYLNWLLNYPCQIDAVIRKDDKRYNVNGIVGNVCYTFMFEGNEYTHYGSYILNNKLREFFLNSDTVRICFYPRLRLSLIKNAFN